VEKIRLVNMIDRCADQKSVALRLPAPKASAAAC